jgi:hypothetical protein
VFPRTLRAVDPKTVALHDPPALLVSTWLCSDRIWCPC